MSKLLLHIGYPKTGSTWLQQFLFNNEDAGFVAPWRKDEVRKNLISPHAFDFRAADVREVFNKSRERCGTQSCPVVSKERLAGCPFYGGYDSRELADRLIQVFPGASVLIVIREQKNMIRSVYNHYVKRGGASTLSEFAFPLSGPHMPQFDFRFFEYDRLIEYYFGLYGRDRVFVLPYELFQSEPTEYVRQIADYCRIEISDSVIQTLPYVIVANSSLSACSVSIKRALNSLVLKENTFNLKSLLPIKISNRKLKSFLYAFDNVLPTLVAGPNSRLEIRQRELIDRLAGNRFAESNVRTSQLTGLDLASFGYDLESKNDLSTTFERSTAQGVDRALLAS